MEAIFIIMLLITSVALLVAILTALIGLFSKDVESRKKLFAFSAKSTLVFALAFVIGFGACVGMF